MRNYLNFEKTVRVHLLFNLLGRLLEAACHQIQSFLQILKLSQEASWYVFEKFCRLLLSLDEKLWQGKTVLSKRVEYRIGRGAWWRGRRFILAVRCVDRRLVEQLFEDLVLILAHEFALLADVTQQLITH